MDRVWLVWQGEYSDKGVIAVFDNERDAEVHAAMVDDYCYVESRPIGKAEYSRDKEIGYTIDMCYCDNEYRWFTIDSYFAYRVGKNRPKINDVTIRDYGKVVYYRVNVVANSKDSAVKKASDVIAKYRAKKLGL